MPFKKLTEEEKKINKEKRAASQSNEDVKAKRELYEKNQEIEALKKELEFAKNQPSVQAEVPKVDDSVLEGMKAQIELLSRQVVASKLDGKLKFREPNANDLVSEGQEITFTARNILYIIASYRDHRGIEIVAPHKLIVFQYAASDIRKDGKEETVKNFCQFTTNLKTEIDFLRNSPYYGITFSENTNEMMDEDVLDTRFKVRAATQLASASPENIFAMADQYKIPNWRNKSPEQLRILIVHKMADEFKKQNADMQKEIAKRNMLGRAVLNSKDE